jgi:3'-phosphoadenosine 5'-phosphosulfate (PAPS) 3'-phosphatase
MLARVVGLHIAILSHTISSRGVSSAAAALTVTMSSAAGGTGGAGAGGRGGGVSRVNLLDLAAAAVACTVSAGRTIQHISQPRNNHENGHGNHDDDTTTSTSRKNTQLKPDGTFVTDADFAAQGIIVQALHSVSPDIRIMGEESKEDMERHIGKYEFLDLDILQRTRRELLLRRRRQQQQQAQARNCQDGQDHGPSSSCNGTNGHYEESINNHSTANLPLSPITTGESTTSTSTSEQEENDSLLLEHLELTEQDLEEVVVDASRVVCIVDPLDGTKSYAHGEYDCVSILISIIVDNEPHFGVIGKPFGYSGFTSILDTSCATIYGGALTHGVFVAGGKQIIASPINSGREHNNDDLPKAVISTSRSKGVVHDFCVHLGEKALVSPEPMLISGAGEKSLRLIVQRNNEAIWFFPKPGTYLWDVAAPDALLRSLGGKLTNKYGKNLDYSKSRDEAENVEGVVACIDSDLHAECIRLFHEGDWINQQ